MHAKSSASTGSARSLDSSDAQPEGGATESGEALPGARLLLVDDKSELLDSLHALLTAHGYDAEKALGGPAAMQALRENSYDVILLDLIMPEVSGHDILDFVAREMLDTKVIVVSGDSSFSGVKHALHCGAFDFVKKPYEAGELIATMETALRQCHLEAENHAMGIRLQKSEELHRFIVDNSPDLVYMLDRDGCFTFVNERIETLLGYERNELIGKHYSELVDKGYLKTARYRFNERRSGNRARGSVELRLRSRIVRKGSRFLDAQSIWVELSAEGIYSDANERSPENFVGTYGTARDITQRKEHEQQINFQAYHDLLTHLPNRALLEDRLNLAITQARRNQAKLAVMFLDLDRFKLVNDTLGHGMGDRLLQNVARRLKTCLRSGDTLSRHGGDEFTLLLPEVRTKEDVGVIAAKILEALNKPFIIDNHELFVGASIGVAMYPEAGETVESLIQNADIAMYHTKSRGKNGYEFFSEEMNARFSTRLNVERELRNALAQGELRVFYQPQVALEDGSITGVEALVRWQHPVRGLVPPDDFLPIAEETGLIMLIDEFVQQQAFDDVARWRQMGFADIRISVNLSAVQLEQENFVKRFVGMLQASNLPPGSVKVEITENTLMQDIEAIIPKLRAMQRHGVRIAIDDFGTGYSSLSYLQQFPINTLKVDRSFVANICADETDASIIDAIVAMARGLKIDLIAEGVENRTQLKYLCAQGCSEAQGYLFSRPVPGPEICSLLEHNSFDTLLNSAQKVAGTV
tara:strand:- start:146 stop:2407 length:2262 start_codon:yes stop_codon:yes gene_type:complete